jgi:hypothetical protein
MRHSQIRDKFHAKVRNLSRTDPDIFFHKLGHHLLFVAVTKEESFSGINHHVITEVGTRRHQCTKFFGAIRPGTRVTVQKPFSGPEPTDMQRIDTPIPCFEDVELASTAETLLY